MGVGVVLVCGIGKAALLLLVVAACAPQASPTSTPTPAATAEPLTVAIVSEIALREAGSAATAVDSVKFGPLKELVDPQEYSGFDPDRTIWAVIVSGEWAGSCPPTTPRRPCPVAFRHALIGLDYVTGAFLFEALMS
jgi:hypothetical protein